MFGALEGEGYVLVEAENGEDAIDAYLEYRPDLIIMDVMMPVMNGYTACQEILNVAEGQKPIVIMFTALNDEQAVEQATKAGATDFFTKPVNLSALRNRIAQLLTIQEKEAKEAEEPKEQ